jgi:AmmeMemoRadiSam system protein A
VKTPEISAEDKRTLLQLARQALHDYLSEGKQPQCQTDAPALLVPRATFVTLRQSGDLRGCRGECPARRSLIESVAYMAIASATDDPRFSPVTIDELADIRIEISVLTPMTPIRPEEVEVGRHGLMIKKSRNSGLLLPQVAVRFGWDSEKFLAGVCRKAGLAEDAWKDEDVTLLGFEAEKWGEED